MESAGGGGLASPPPGALFRKALDGPQLVFSNVLIMRTSPHRRRPVKPAFPTLDQSGFNRARTAATYLLVHVGAVRAKVVEEGLAQYLDAEESGEFSYGYIGSNTIRAAAFWRKHFRAADTPILSMLHMVPGYHLFKDGTLVGTHPEVLAMQDGELAAAFLTALITKGSAPGSDCPNASCVSGRKKPRSSHQR